jgi:glutaminyl-tRNA synthetase
MCIRDSLYEHLLTVPDPNAEDGRDFLDLLNPNSLEVLTACQVEPSLKDAQVGGYYQFERVGYFTVDPDTSGSRLVFNRTVTLKDEWAKIQKAQSS